MTACCDAQSLPTGGSYHRGRPSFIYIRHDSDKRNTTQDHRRINYAMAFDWLSFFHRYSIEHEPQRRDWVQVWCPWCGGSGTHRIGINTTLGIYHCWHGHSGKSPQRLIMMLIGCSYQEANRLVGAERTSYVRSDESFANSSLRMLGINTDTSISRMDDLAFLPEFTPLDTARGVGRVLAIPYMNRRGYDSEALPWIVKRYNLKFAPTGPFAYRIIIPVVKDGELVTWTGRTVADSEPLRYKTLSPDAKHAAAENLPPAVVNIKDTLLDWDRLQKGGDTLVVTEGPFDAVRVGFFGAGHGIRATCIFGLSRSLAQIALLTELAPKYRQVIILFDRDAAFAPFLNLPDYLNTRMVDLPLGVKDPAELTWEQFAEVFGL